MLLGTVAIHREYTHCDLQLLYARQSSSYIMLTVSLLHRATCKSIGLPSPLYTPHKYLPFHAPDTHFFVLCFF